MQHNSPRAGICQRALFGVLAEYVMAVSSVTQPRWSNIWLPTTGAGPGGAAMKATSGRQGVA